MPEKIQRELIHSNECSQYNIAPRKPVSWIYIRTRDQRSMIKDISISNNFLSSFREVCVKESDVTQSNGLSVRVFSGDIAKVNDQLMNKDNDLLSITINSDDSIKLKQENCDRILTGLYLVNIEISNNNATALTIYPVMNAILHFRVPKPHNWTNDDQMSLLCNWSRQPVELKEVDELCKIHSLQQISEPLLPASLSGTANSLIGPKYSLQADDEDKTHECSLSQVENKSKKINVQCIKDENCKSCASFLQASVTVPTMVQSNQLLKIFHAAEFQELKFTIKRLKKKGGSSEDSKTHSIWLSAGKTKRIHELDVLVEFNKRPEFKTPWLECKKDRLLVDFANFLGNVRKLDSPLRLASNVKKLYGKMLVPNIVDDGSYASLEEDNPHAWFNIWGKDLEDEKKDEHTIMPKSAISYCQLRQIKYPDRGDARKLVVQRLRKVYKEREGKVFEELKRLSFPLKWTDEMHTDVFACGLVNTANEVHSIQYEKMHVLHVLLKHSAAIIRGRIEARFVGEKIHRGCLVVKAWFAFMMAVWQQMLRLAKTKTGENLSDKFSEKVRDADVPNPIFFTWPSDSIVVDT